MPEQSEHKLPSWLLPAAGLGVVALVLLNRGGGGMSPVTADPLMQQAKAIQLQQAADQAQYQTGLRQLDFAQKKLALGLQSSAINQYLAAPYKCPKGSFAKDAQGNLYCRTSAGGTGIGGLLNNVQQWANQVLGLVTTGEKIAHGLPAPRASRPRYTPGTI